MPVHPLRLSASLALIGMLGLSACSERKLETDSSAEPSAIGSAAPTGQPAPVADLAPSPPPAPATPVPTAAPTPQP